MTNNPTQPPVSVIETPTYQKDAARIFTQDEADGVISDLSNTPEAGALIRGTGGVRKFRVAAKGKGKSGGARVIYYYYDGTIPLYLLAAYAKNEATDLTEAEKKDLAAQVEEILAENGKK